MTGYTSDIATAILYDSRKIDKVFGRNNNLTKEIIQSLISQGCHYCGETTIRMTLDRKRNEEGHTTDNVVPACIRCNNIRRDMPYEAWLCLVDGLRTATRSGLFGTWIGGFHKNRKKETIGDRLEAGQRSLEP